MSKSRLSPVQDIMVPKKKWSSRLVGEEIDPQVAESQNLRATENRSKERSSLDPVKVQFDDDSF